jgi:hypothetical protein
MEMIFLIALPLAIIVGIAAEYRGRSGIGWFLLSFLLTPFVGLLLLVLPDLRYSRKCPHCAELVLPEATVCKHCHRDLPPLPAGSMPATWPWSPSRKTKKAMGPAPSGEPGTYRGYDYVVCLDGTAELKLSSGQWRKYPTVDELKIYVDVITGHSRSA